MLSPFCITSHIFKQVMPKGGGLAIVISGVISGATSGKGGGVVNPAAPIHFFEAKLPDFAFV
ncbi:hypothetical protein EN41_08355 [Agrobacterium tumefaciens]|nr:hypothetical protein EN41_08355 [Agrobacterium tumefaciens]QRM58460.1 hypothetical protein F3P66_02720 [Agrobacterium fabrum]TRB29227.1 hypothetical protein EXN51_11895 [Agrobacterium fabrum]